MQMNAEIKAQWLSALRSGNYTQGRNYLKTCEGEFCCLGVLSDLAVKSDKPFSWEQRWDGDVYHVSYGNDMLNRHYLPGIVSDWAGLYYEIFGGQGYIEVNNAMTNGEHFRFSLAELNDDGFTFEQIADVIDYFL